MEGDAVFRVFCTVVGADVLLDVSSIEALLSGAGDVAIQYRCSCGERGVWRPGEDRPQDARRACGKSRFAPPSRSGTGSTRPEPETRAG